MKKLLLCLLMVSPLVADTTNISPLAVSDVVAHPDLTKLVDKRIKKKKDTMLYKIGISAASAAVTSVFCCLVMRKLLE